MTLNEHDQQLVEALVEQVRAENADVARVISTYESGVRQATAILAKLKVDLQAQERTVALRTACVEALTGLSEQI